MVQKTRRGAQLMAVAVGLGGLLAGCSTLDGLLDVPAPDRVESDVLDDPSQAQLLIDGVQAAFECAFNAHTVFTATLGPEFGGWQMGWYALTVVERRALQASGAIDGMYAWGDCVINGGSDYQFFGLYRPVQTARWYASDVFGKLDEWSDADVPERTALMARAALYAGFSTVLLGEGFCSAAVDGGPELTPAEVFALAEQWFDQAITIGGGAGAADVAMAGRIGRARVRLSLGNTAGALADAQAVPDGFVYSATFSAAANSRNNLVFGSNNRDLRMTVDEDYRDLSWDGVPDPRVPLSFNPADTLTCVTCPGQVARRLYRQLKYTSVSSPIPIAKWQEARLIAAEVQGGQQAVAIINALHAAAGLPPTFASSDPAAIRDHIVEERRREFFLEGRRVYDMIRFDVPFLPAAGTPHPYIGGVYGTNTCLPLPNDERDNNPNI